MHGQKQVEGGVGRSREPKLSVCCPRTSAHPFLAKNRPGAPVFGHCRKNKVGSKAQVHLFLVIALKIK